MTSLVPARLSIVSLSLERTWLTCTCRTLSALESLGWHWLSIAPGYINICSTQTQAWESPALQWVDVDGQNSRGTALVMAQFSLWLPPRRALSCLFDNSVVCINDDSSRQAGGTLSEMAVLTLVIKYPKAIANPLLSPDRLRAAH